MAVHDISRSGTCLAGEVMTAYLEGALQLDEKAAAETHLAECTPCRETFALLMRMLNRQGQPATPDEEGALAAVCQGWRGRPSARFHRYRQSRLVGLFGVAAGILMAFLWFYGAGPEGAGTASAIVLSLLNDNRPYEPRLAGQAYREFERTRAAEPPSNVDYDLLADEMVRLKPGPYSMGRFYLLGRDLTRAIPLLEEAAAREDMKERPDVLNDLGAAYLARGNSQDLDRAEKVLGKASQIDDRFAAPVFNLALLYETMRDRTRARETWRRYLQLDAESGWSGEARRRLEVIR